MNCSDNGEDWGDVTDAKQEALEEMVAADLQRAINAIDVDQDLNGSGVPI